MKNKRKNFNSGKRFQTQLSLAAHKVIRDIFFLVLLTLFILVSRIFLFQSFLFPCIGGDSFRSLQAPTVLSVQKCNGDIVYIGCFNWSSHFLMSIKLFFSLSAICYFVLAPTGFSIFPWRVINSGNHLYRVEKCEL